MEGFRELREGVVFADDFRIVRPLGAGGMGAVYLVEQISTGVRRALKLMRAELALDSKARTRFVQEAKVSGRIRSEHIVQVIGAGVEPRSGIPWLAMELLEGEDLAAHLRRRGKTSTSECAAIFLQLGHALTAAHEAGVIHRDLKPENIFLASVRHAKVGVSVKVLDFGIARITAEAVTAATSAIGTPLWMAPEQTEVGGAIGPATDIWPLGLIAFRALTGRHYYRGGDDPAIAVQALVRQIVFDPLIPASVRAAELGCEGELPEDFDAWFARCVRREIPARFASVAEAIDALREALGSPATARVLDVLITDEPPLDDRASSGGGRAGGGIELAMAKTEVAPPAIPEPGGTMNDASVTQLPVDLGVRSSRRIAAGITAAGLVGAAIITSLLLSNRNDIKAEAFAFQLPDDAIPPARAVTALVSAPAAADHYELPIGCSQWEERRPLEKKIVTVRMRLCREGLTVKGWQRTDSASGFLETVLAGTVEQEGRVALREIAIVDDRRIPGVLRCLHSFELQLDREDQMVGSSVTLESDDSKCRKRTRKASLSRARNPRGELLPVEPR